MLCLLSPPNDRDAWIYRDVADSNSYWGIYHRQIHSPVGKAQRQDGAGAHAAWFRDQHVGELPAVRAGLRGALRSQCRQAGACGRPIAPCRNARHVPVWRGSVRRAARVTLSVRCRFCGSAKTRSSSYANAAEADGCGDAATSSARPLDEPHAVRKHGGRHEHGCKEVDDLRAVGKADEHQANQQQHLLRS